jgi:hypothetical protein
MSSADPSKPNPKPRGTTQDASGALRYRATGPAPREGLSALPSTFARGVAFASIMLAGALGAVLGYGIGKVFDRKGSSLYLGVSALIGALIVASGVAVVAVLVLRAMGEWRALDRPLPPNRVK